VIVHLRSLETSLAFSSWLLTPVVFAVPTMLVYGPHELTSFREAVSERIVIDISSAAYLAAA
jgi:uncharacterized membrane protein